LGHDAGDEVLKTVAHRLLALLRNADTMARLGGDEFVVLLDNPEHREAVAHVAERIVTSVNLPIQIGNNPARVGCSIGIAWHLEQGTSAGALLKIADAAMYVAKAAGKNTFRFG
jgi:diguanylate cyclase (GGDEF)-like protein